MQRPGQNRPTLRAYLGTWWVLGGVALLGGLLTTVVAPPAGPRLHPLALLAVVALAFLTDVGPLQTPLRRASVSVNLYEVAVLVGLVLLPPLVVPAAVTLGIASSMLLVHRISPVKVAFNAAMLGTAATAAVLPVVLLDAAPPLPTELPGLVLLLVAGAIFSLVNLAALAGLLRLLDPRDGPATSQLDYLRASGIGLVIGNCLGAILAAAITTAPLVVPLFPVVGWLTTRGLAERLRRLTADAAQHARMERTIAGATEGICLVDARGEVELLNPAACRLLGCDPASAVGRPLDELLPADAEPPAPVAAALRSRTPDDASEDVSLRVDGSTWQVELTALFDHDGRDPTTPTGAVVLLWDATEELRATRLRQEFVARVSHELRTPLTAIVGFAETLRLRLEELDPVRQREFLTVIERQGARLSRLVDDLLWSARSEAGTITTSPEPVLLRRLAADVTAGVHHLLGGTRLEWSVGDTVVLADRGHLEQVLINLVSNAATYGAPPFRIAARTLGARAIIEVSDAGDGVPAAFVPHLFDPFAQATTGDRRESRGLGLGLAIVSTLLAHNDGSITYDRRDGRSVFVLTIPAG